MCILNVLLEKLIVAQLHVNTHRLQHFISGLSAQLTLQIPAECRRAVFAVPRVRLSVVKPCHDSGGLSPAFHCEDPGLIRCQSM